MKWAKQSICVILLGAIEVWGKLRSTKLFPMLDYARRFCTSQCCIKLAACILWYPTCGVTPLAGTRGMGHATFCPQESSNSGLSL